MPRRGVQITPEVLAWARSRADYTVEEMRRVYPRYGEWETGAELPTYIQVENLSERFKVPVAVFFFPEPPEEEPIQNSFRTLTDPYFRRIPRRVKYLLRKAKALQISLSELNDGHNPSDKLIFKDVVLLPEVQISETAKRVRDYLDISVDRQVKWENTDTAFKNWRNALENHGVAVFKDAFQDRNYSGFCIYDQTFPLIYVNNSVVTRQIFTLFHELGHILFQTSGIDVVDDGFYDELPDRHKNIEDKCNRFAAELLLPEAHLRRELTGKAVNRYLAERIARKYHVSRQSVFRRFLDWGMVAWVDYDAAVQEWMNQEQPSHAGQDGGNYYWTKLTYLGTNFVGLALSRYYERRISEWELAGHLDIKVSKIPELEDYFMRSR